MRLIILLLIVGAIAGFFTRPEEAAMRAQADTVLEDVSSPGEFIEGAGAQLLGNRTYNNFYVASQYIVTLNNEPIVQCWGAFTHVKCDRVQQS